MKIFITNKKDFEFALEHRSKRAHSQLYNEVLNNFNNENIIEVLHYVSFNDQEFGVLFQFVGKNKDMFFYEYVNTTN